MRRAGLALPALALTAGAAWVYLAYMAWGMAHMEVGAGMLLMPAMAAWTASDVALVFLMWAVMMAAMMLPTAVPMLRTFARMARAQRPETTGDVPALAFALGYLALWTGFSLVATLAQWGLLEARLVSPMMASASPVFSAVLLLAAGAFQFSRLKQACLGKCRSPLGFLMTEWRAGASGAWIMGLRHGAFCLGCCGALMLLLFVLGVMNLWWIALLTLVVLAEKTLPVAGNWPSRLLGAGLLVWGSLLLIFPAG
jgi:predicted metal-binding membrane protein